MLSQWPTGCLIDGMTKPLLVCAITLLLSSPAIAAAEPAREFLRYLFGAEEVKVAEVCWPNDDLWMIAGPKDDRVLAEIAALKLAPGKNEVVWEKFTGGLCIIELREGKADPRFILDQVYFRQRQTVLRFIYAAMERDLEDLGEVATNPKKVSFGRTKPAAHSDLGVYAEMIAMLPVVRIRQPAEDKATKSATYLLPLGPRGFKVRVVKRKGAWLVDTDAGVDVPLEVFFKEDEERKVIYAP